MQKQFNSLPVFMLACLIAGCQPEKKLEVATHDHQEVHSKTSDSMNVAIPSSLKAEHHELHLELEKLLKLPGKTGEAAKKVADALHHHFEKEEEYAMPPLGLLNQLAKGETPPDKKEVLELTEKLKAEMPQMLEEHKQIVSALNNLKTAATAENHPEAIKFVEKLKLHAETEEQVLYPAAILVGEYLKLK